MIGALWLSVRAAAYVTGWATGTTLAVLARTVSKPPAPPRQCPCICCTTRTALLAAGREPWHAWCDCLDYPERERCDCTPCRQMHRPCEAVP